MYSKSATISPSSFLHWDGFSLFFLLAGVIVLGLRPSPVSASGRGPRITVAEERFDFGDVPQHCEVSHVFWLHNTGDEPLVIEKLVPNCGCTDAPLEKSRVPVGDSTRVEVIFGSGLFSGPVTKFTQIVSNCAGRAPALTFTARVFPDSTGAGPLVAIPSAIDLRRIRLEPDSGQWEASVTLKNVGDHPIRVRTIDRPDRNLSVTPVDTTLAPKGKLQVALKFEDDLPDQVFSKSITFSVSDSVQNRLTVPVFKTVYWGPLELSH